MCNYKYKSYFSIWRGIFKDASISYAEAFFPPTQTVPLSSTNVYRDKSINHLEVQESLEFLGHLVFLVFLAVQEDPCFLGWRIFSRGLQVDLAAKI